MLFAKDLIHSSSRLLTTSLTPPMYFTDPIRRSLGHKGLLGKALISTDGEPKDGKGGKLFGPSDPSYPTRLFIPTSVIARFLLFFHFVPIL